jgi:uncharacterized protein YecE (DUF72 family)
VEFRHLSWHCAETFALLAEREIAYCVAGQDVYVYFNNDGNANAVRNAHTLHALLATALAAGAACRHRRRPASRKTAGTKRMFDSDHAG